LQKLCLSYRAPGCPPCRALRHQGPAGRAFRHALGAGRRPLSAHASYERPADPGHNGARQHRRQVQKKTGIGG
jgi:hypothetical protein